MGQKHIELQNALKKYLNVDNVELLVNGHMALEMTLQAMNLQGEVITTPFTFASTTHAIVRNGLTPVFCDIRPDDFTMDADKIESLITDRTCAIMPVHVYGNVCDVEKIQKIADKYGLKVIYDAAHTFGVKYKGQGTGTFGDVSCFSFHATKVFHTIEGGAACFKDEELGRTLYRLKNFGIKNEEVVDGVGANAKMNEFQAAMGLCNLRHIESEIEKRRLVTECYRQCLTGVKGIQLNTIQKDVISNYAYFPILVNSDVCKVNRDELYNKLKEQNIFARKYFYPITSEFDCYKGKFDVVDTPVAKKISENVLTLPMYADLPLETVERICSVVAGLVE